MRRKPILPRLPAVMAIAAFVAVSLTPFAGGSASGIRPAVAVAAQPARGGAGRTPKPSPTPKPTPKPSPTPKPTPKPTPTPTATATASPTPTPTAPYSALLARAPYLTDLTQSSVEVIWATTQQGHGTLRWGPLGSCSQNLVSIGVFSQVNVAPTGYTRNDFQDVMTISGLAPSTSYCYRIYAADGTDLLGTDPSPVFTTLDPVDPQGTTPLTFAVIGDFGDNTDGTGALSQTTFNASQAALDALIAGSGARFVLAAGDIGYSDGSQSNYGDLWETGTNAPGGTPAQLSQISNIFGPRYWGQVRGVPMFAADGNHGQNNNLLRNWPQDATVAASGGTYAMTSYPAMDGANAASYPGSWYAFSSGNVRVYVLTAAWADGNVGSGNGGLCGSNASACAVYQVDHDQHWLPTSPEYQWLQADLASHSGGIKFAVFHYPLRSDNATQPGDPYLQNVPGNPASLEELLSEYGVGIAFNGHAHLYQRNAPTGAGQIVSYVTGGGGGRLEPVGTGSSPCSATDAYALGWSYSKGQGNSCGGAPVPTSTAQVFHYLKVTVVGSQVTVTPINALGQPFDVQAYDFSPSDATPPTIPAGLTVQGATDTSVSLAWSASSDAAGVSGYTIYRDGIAVGTSPTTSFTDAGLTPSTSYGYSVDAFDAAGNHSNQSSPPVPTTTLADASPPSVPGGVGATTLTSTSVRVTWTASTDDVGVAGYTICRDAGAGPVVVGTAGPTDTSFVDSGLSPSTTYGYTVGAFDAAGNASLPSSPPASATTPGSATILFSDDFESGDLSAWTSKGGLTPEQSLVHGGTWAVEGNATNGQTYAKKTLGSTSATVHSSVWYQVKSGASTANLLWLRDASGANLGYLWTELGNATTPGRLVLKDAVTNGTFYGTVAPGPGWHHVEWSLAIAGTSSTYQVLLDGAPVGGLSGTTDWGSTPVGQFQIGDTNKSGRTYDIVFDDAEIDVPGT